LRSLEDDEKQIAINGYIRKQFFSITQLDLTRSPALSQIICEMCFDSTRDLANFRSKLIENQRVLEGNLENSVVFENQQQEVFAKSPKAESDDFKVEPEFETEIEVVVKDEFYEEHLDQDLLESFNDQPSFVEDTKKFEVLVVEEKSRKRKVKGTSEKKKLCSGEISRFCMF
jgi:hypothetical protein